MEPTIAAGEYVLVSRLTYLFKRPCIGDIVALRDPRDKKVLIKRIAEIKGDTYKVEGDNKNHSTDSRVFGMIGIQAIIGKIWS